MKKINKVKCTHCGGSGYHGKRKCPVCKGTGYVKRSITVKRKGIPKVVDSTTILNPETKIIVIQAEANNRVCPRSG